MWKSFDLRAQTSIMELDDVVAQHAKERYPLLAFALKRQERATAVKIEWLNRLADGSFRAEWNYQQIVRTPFRVGEGEALSPKRREHFEKHLQDIERTLWYGVPSFNLEGHQPFTMCGGVLYYLQREPTEGDIIKYKPLRPTLLYSTEYPGGSRDEEYLTEFSLMVVPARPILRAELPRQCFPQGSRL